MDFKHLLNKGKDEYESEAREHPELETGTHDAFKAFDETEGSYQEKVSAFYKAFHKEREGMTGLREKKEE